ncbi:uncharacterized protein LOC144448501 [Glandiceps talaboti]
MTLSIEQVMADAKKLVDRLTEHDSNTDTLIAQTETLNKRIDAMKQYQEDLAEMNEAARHRPRSALVLGIQQENRQIRELQHENKELRTALEEHQSALELIMTKYREQVLKLVLANKVDSNSLDVHQNNSKELQTMTQKICEMAMVMSEAVNVDDDAVAKETELITRLQVENKGLREILGISRQFRKPWPKKYPRDDSYGVHVHEQFQRDLTQKQQPESDDSVTEIKAKINIDKSEENNPGVPGGKNNDSGNNVMFETKESGEENKTSVNSESIEHKSGDLETVSGDLKTAGADDTSGSVETVDADDTIESVETVSGDVETVDADDTIESIETVSGDTQADSGVLETEIQARELGNEAMEELERTIIESENVKSGESDDEVVSTEVVTQEEIQVEIQVDDKDGNADENTEKGESDRSKRDSSPSDEKST